jgi:hypothetical protein
VKRSDLKVGDRVWVVLPYEGGRGWATLLDFVDSGARVSFQRFYNHINNWQDREVSLRQIHKKEEPID